MSRAVSTTSSPTLAKLSKPGSNKSSTTRFLLTGAIKSCDSARIVSPKGSSSGLSLLAAIDELIESRIHGTGRFADRGPARRTTRNWQPDRRFVQHPFPNAGPPADPAPPGRHTINRHLPDGGFVQTVVPHVGEFPNESPDSNLSDFNSSPFMVNGVEIAGLGPMTTDSYRAKVKMVLKLLDPLVAEWWESISIQGDVRSRSVIWGWSNFTLLENDRPVIVVDKSFTSGQTAQGNCPRKARTPLTIPSKFPSLISGQAVVLPLRYLPNNGKVRHAKLRKMPPY